MLVLTLLVCPQPWSDKPKPWSDKSEPWSDKPEPWFDKCTSPPCWLTYSAILVCSQLNDKNLPNAESITHCLFVSGSLLLRYVSEEGLRMV